MHNVYKEALAVSVQRIFNGILSHTEGIMLMPMAVHGGCVHFCQQEDCGCIYSVCMCKLHITHAIYINITHVLEMHAQWITRGRPSPWLYPFVAMIIMQGSTVINAPLLRKVSAPCTLLHPYLLCIVLIAVQAWTHLIKATHTFITLISTPSFNTSAVIWLGADCSIQAGQSAYS